MEGQGLHAMPVSYAHGLSLCMASHGGDLGARIGDMLSGMFLYAA